MTSGALTKAYFEIEDGTTLSFLFNPAQLQVSMANSWSGECASGQSAPSLTFEGGAGGTITLNLVFDTTDTGTTVTDYTDTLAALLAPRDDLSDYDADADNVRPPWVQLHWGDRHFFKSVVTSLSLAFTYFTRDGTPLRARADLTLQQLGPEDTLPLQNPTSHTPRIHRVHTVQAGETLDRLAADYYGDPNDWRLIAAANRILNPLALRPGTRLAIPHA